MTTTKIAPAADFWTVGADIEDTKAPKGVPVQEKLSLIHI